MVLRFQRGAFFFYDYQDSPVFPSAKSKVVMKMKMEYSSNNTEWRKQKYSQENMSPCHFSRHKSLRRETVRINFFIVDTGHTT